MVVGNHIVIGSGVIVWALARWAEKTGKAWECAALYSAMVLIAGLVFPIHGFGNVFIRTICSFFITWLLFAIVICVKGNQILKIGAIALGIFMFWGMNHYFGIQISRPVGM